MCFEWMFCFWAIEKRIKFVQRLASETLQSKMNPQIQHTLKTYKLRQTDCREDVLSLFIDKPFALAHANVEGLMATKYDRVTIYRTLKTFVEAGLLHKVLDDEGSLKYALCKEPCHTPDHSHHHDHVHFKCNVCGQTNCLEDVLIPSFSLPNGYQRHEINMLVQGVCPSCA
jgi:Fur family transcriptional regulator, ferric uptake regulator